VRAFERLLRKLLARPGAPAVVLMQALATDIVKARQPFHMTVEDHYGVLAQYFGVGWLSMRDACFRGLVAGWDGLRADQVFQPGDERHPSEVGHKYMADLAVTLLQRIYLDLLLGPPDGGP
jgi:hypothetical protein